MTKEEKREYMRQYRKAHPKTAEQKAAEKERRKTFFEENPEKRQEYDKKSYRNRREKILSEKKEYHKKVYPERKEKILLKQKERRAKNPEPMRKAEKKYRDTHLEQQKAKKVRYFKKNASAKIGAEIQKRLIEAITIGRKSKKYNIEEIIGCSISELKKHLEAQFQPGMTWENRGNTGWHIDHIKPKSSFDLSDPEQQKACFHYTNLQPLWEADNLKKGAKHG